MRVKFLKNHIHYVKDQEVEANEGMGTYWIRVGIAEEVTQNQDVFDPEKRRKELTSMKKAQHENIIVSLVLDPADYKNAKSRIDAIIEEETRIHELSNLSDDEEITPPEEDFKEEE